MNARLVAVLERERLTGMPRWNIWPDPETAERHSLALQRMRAEEDRRRRAERAAARRKAKTG